MTNYKTNYIASYLMNDTLHQDMKSMINLLWLYNHNIDFHCRVNIHITFNVYTWLKLTFLTLSYLHFISKCDHTFTCLH